MVDKTHGLDRKTQEEVSDMFNIGTPTIRKWNEHIVDTLELEVWF